MKATILFVIGAWNLAKFIAGYLTGWIVLPPEKTFLAAYRAMHGPLNQSGRFNNNDSIRGMSEKDRIFAMIRDAFPQIFKDK